MNWFNAIPMKWRMITATAFEICWISMYFLGKKTGKEQAIEACAWQARGRDYTWSSDVLIQEEFKNVC